MINYSDVDSRLSQVEQLINEYEAEQVNWLNSRPFQMNTRPSPSGEGDDLIFGLASPVPSRLGILYGRCIEGLCNALDDLVMALAKGSDTNFDGHALSFPICGTFGEYFGYEDGQEAASPGAEHGAFQVNPLSTDAKTFVENQQPFKSHDRGRSLYELNFLRGRVERIVMEPVVVAMSRDPEGATVNYDVPLRLAVGQRFATITYHRNYSGPKGPLTIMYGLGVEHSNGIGWHDPLAILRGKMFQNVQEIIEEAKELFH